MKVVTFYSFKGGVGRSLALANVSLLLATRGRRVLAVDFDLEAPGLSMMSDLVPNPRKVERGLFEYLLALLNDENTNLADYLIYPEIEGVDFAFLPAGNLKDGYDLSELDFARLLEEGERNPLSQFRREIEELGFTYALLDSRTGMTEIAATCTLGLADVVVMLAGLNEQNLQGTRWVLDMLEGGGELRSEDIIIVFSPVPEAEEELKAERLQRAHEIVGGRDVLLLPYHPRLALIEELFVKEWQETSLAQKYRQLASEIYRRNPDDIEAIIEEGRRLFFQNAEIDKAKENFDKALQINSNDGEANFYAGIIASIKKQYEDAARYYRLSIETDEEVPMLQWNLGDLPTTQNFFKVEAYNNLGVVLGKLARLKNDGALLEKAMQNFQQAIGLNPNHVKAYNNWGTTLIDIAIRRQDESLLEEAIQKYRKAIEINSDYAEAYSNLGIALIHLAKRRNDKSLFNQAIQIYKQALSLNEHDPRFHNNLAHSLIQIGEYEEAEKHCLKALELEEHHLWHDTYGELLLKVGRLEEAEKHFLHSLELKETEPETHEHYAQLLRQIGHPEEAEKHERRAQELRSQL